ncbi:MAG: hypothetical protein PVJ83_07015 [Gammaproteobacteria bacterium]|jgi:hypothetical protein
MNTTVSVPGSGQGDERLSALQYINLRLAALGQPTLQLDSDQSYLEVADSLLKSYSRQQRMLASYRCPADQRIQDFVNAYLQENEVDTTINLPGATFVLDRKGLARELSLPVEGNCFRSELVESYRLLQGVLHNPVNDRRTTKGVFHIAAGGLPVPADKREVPVVAFAGLLQAALNPPHSLLQLPITSEQQEHAALWASLLVRPLVQPEIAGVLPAKTMETRMFAPGGLVSNLDFVESIFGNGGDPFLPENDAALDIEHWTGHTGCIILAPHLVNLTKKALGLPSHADASDRQRRDGMCWQADDELYNDGKPFKIVCRDLRGVVVTIIADNYFGYSKKEIKSQISYSANLFGGCEEEHAGGALAFPRFNLGQSYRHHRELSDDDHTFETLCRHLEPWIEVKDNGYALDKTYEDIVYIRENASIDIRNLRVSWVHQGEPYSIKLLAGRSYVYPSGFKVHMERHPHAPSWRLIGTVGEGTFCHKPSTVSGGGKSEISKSLAANVISGAVYVGDIDQDLELVASIFERDYSTRFRYPEQQDNDQRNLLSTDRSLGSVIKLLTPSLSEYSDEYNQWVDSLPQHILALVFMIKRFYDPAWGSHWRRHFSVDNINGYPGHELKLDGRKLIASNLRVGTRSDGNWRVFKLRQDFVAAEKVQMEDDITASTVIPADYVEGLSPACSNPCIKLTDNCEAKLFQRPDDAVNRGIDLQTEADLSGNGNFISNFQPLSVQDARDILEDVVHFESYSAPMKKLVRKAVEAPQGSYFVSSAHPRLVDGKPTQNVRYLQVRPDLANPRMRYLAEQGTRLARGLDPDQPLFLPVNAVIPGRRNNPIDKKSGVRPLAVYSPIHYQELPELFMDFISSLTGKSPSTTGAGSEGALTKAPFNSLSATADLNTALVSYILCGYHGYSTAAGHIGERRRVDHDISMLIPEIWCRMAAGQLEPSYMIEQGYLHKMEDFEYEGRNVLASRLGYRITEHFVRDHFGKMFDRPSSVFDEAMLCPETQDLESFVDGIDNICEAQRRVAQGYFDDGSVENACPPLQALLHIMAHGDYQGKDIDDPGIREMFTRDYLLQSDWYQERLLIKQTRDEQLWCRHQDYLERQLEEVDDGDDERRSALVERIQKAERMRQVVSDQSYLKHLQGTLGADWIHRDSKPNFITRLVRGGLRSVRSATTRR